MEEEAADGKRAAEERPCVSHRRGRSRRQRRAGRTVQRFWDARNGKLFQQLGTHFESPRSWLAAIEEHRAVLVAIRKHDAKAARQAMQHHMDKAHGTLQRKLRRGQARLIEFRETTGKIPASRQADGR